MSKSFLQLRTEINASVWPSGVPENLKDPLKDDSGNIIAPAPLTMLYIEALSEISKWVPCERTTNTNIHRFCNTYFKCGMSVVEAPRGIIGRVYTVVRDETTAFCSPVFYRQEPWPTPEHWARNLLAQWAEPTDSVPPTLPLGFVRADDTTDRYESGNLVGRSYTGIWARQDNKIYVAPWIQSTEALVIEWKGIKTTWTDDDLVSEDQDFRKAVKLYVQYGYERDYGDAQEADKLHRRSPDGRMVGTFDEALADLIWECRERTKVHPAEPQFDERMSYFLCGFNALCGGTRRGSGPPESTLGNNGDLYVDILTGDVYVKVLGSWTLHTGSGGGGAIAPGVVDPEGVVTGTPGQTYWNTANTTLWIKSSGTGNTGWTQLI